jgi:hypothetical protein
LALLVFPLFREPFGLLVQLYEDGVLPFSMVGWVFSSALLFSLSGAIMMHWMPTLPVRILAGFWTATFILYWADPVIGTMGFSGGGATAGAVVLGALLLVLFFWLLASLGPERNLHFQPVTWRSRMASGWLIVWMGFFTGTSAVLLSEVLLYPLRRGLLSLGALAMAAWSYVLSTSFRKAQGEEEDGVASTWRWLLLAWGLLALLHYFFRVRDGL